MQQTILALCDDDDIYSTKQSCNSFASLAFLCLFVNISIVYSLSTIRISGSESFMFKITRLVSSHWPYLPSKFHVCCEATAGESCGVAAGVWVATIKTETCALR